MKYEYCCKCDAPTGRAGAGEDSLYTEHDGPFCEECFPEQAPEQAQKQEPVAWDDEQMVQFASMVLIQGKHADSIEMRLETFRNIMVERGTSHPPQRQPLTDEQMWKLWNAQGDDFMEQQAAIAFARAIEAAHGIKGEA